MNSRAVLVVYAALAIPALKLSAQIPVTPQPPASAYPTEFENWLDSGSTQNRVQQLVALGVNPQVAGDFTSAENVYLQWKPIRSVGQQKTALLYLPCAIGSDVAHLYALANDGKVWRVSDASGFDCHYDMDVAVDVESIRSPAFDEILVHHACEGHGTGFLQQDLEIFVLVKGRLKPELDTTEVLNSFPTAVTVPHNLEQSSVFVLVPIGASSTRAIEETRSSVLNGNLTVDRRLLRWNAAKAHYLPSKFYRITAPHT